MRKMDHIRKLTPERWTQLLEDSEMTNEGSTHALAFNECNLNQDERTKFETWLQTRQPSMGTWTLHWLNTQEKKDNTTPIGGHGLLIAVNSELMDGGHQIRKLTSKKDKVLTVATKIKATGTRVHLVTCYVKPTAKQPPSKLNKLLLR